MIHADHKALSIKIRTEMLGTPYQRKQLSAGGAVLPLCFREGSACICNHIFTAINILGEDSS